MILRLLNLLFIFLPWSALAEGKIDSLHRQIEKARLDKNNADLQLQYQQLGLYYFYSPQYDSAYKYFNKALSLPVISGDSSNHYIALYRTSLAAREIGLFAGAKTQIDRCNKYFLAQNDTSNLIGSLEATSALFVAAGDLQTAAYYLDSAIRLNSKPNATLTDLLMDLGNIQNELGNTKEANQIYEKALANFKNFPSPEDELYLTFNIGVSFYSDDDHETAIKYWQRCLSLAKEINDLEMEGATLTALSSSYNTIGKSDIAKKYIYRASLIFKKIGLFEDWAYCFYYLGSIERSLGNKKSAIKNLKRAVSIFEENNLLLSLPETYQELAKALADDGNYKESLLYLEKNQSVRDSLFSINQTNQIDSLREKYVAEIREDDIQKLTTLNQIKAIESKAKSTQRNLILVACLCLLLMVGLLYKLNKQKNRGIIFQKDLAFQKIDLLLKEEEIKILGGKLEGQDQERQRISTDLHDRLGSLLGTIFLRFEAIKERLSEDQKPELDKTRNLLNSALEEVRGISHRLTSKVLNTFGLVAALTDLQKSLSTGGKPLFSISASTTPLLISKTQQLEVFKTLQEIVRYSQKLNPIAELNIMIEQAPERFLWSAELTQKKITKSDFSSTEAFKRIKFRVDKLKGEMVLTEVASGKLLVKMECEVA